MSSARKPLPGKRRWKSPAFPAGTVGLERSFSSAQATIPEENANPAATPRFADTQASEIRGDCRGLHMASKDGVSDCARNFSGHVGL
jgi:hypothetical protein